VERRTPDVEVLVAAMAEDQEGRDVHEKAEDGDHEHGAGQDLDRIGEAAGGLNGDPGGDGEEGEAVDEGGQHLEAVIAVGGRRAAGRRARRKANQASASEANR
jgi:hypothetical protein